MVGRHVVTEIWCGAEKLLKTGQPVGDTSQRMVTRHIQTKRVVTRLTRSARDVVRAAYAQIEGPKLQRSAMNDVIVTTALSEEATIVGTGKDGGYSRNTVYNENHYGHSVFFF